MRSIFQRTQYRVSMEFVLLFYAAVGLDWCKPKNTRRPQFVRIGRQQAAYDFTRERSLNDHPSRFAARRERYKRGHHPVGKLLENFLGDNARARPFKNQRISLGRHDSDYLVKIKKPMRQYTRKIF